MKKLCGYDINGWRDLAIRNWHIRPREDIEFRDEGFLIESGLLPSVVQVEHDHSTRWIGGAQADIAPHGKGEGWGDIGHQARRRTVRNCLDDDESSPEILTAAISGLSHGAQFGIAAIDDLPSSSELQQERILNALHHSRVASKLLVWRPVLAVLYAIQQQLVTNNQSVGVLCHSGSGFSVQRLEIRSEQRGGTTVLAPERRHPGKLIESALGYQGLKQVAHDTLVRGEFTPSNQHLEVSKSIGRLALGEPTRLEILRRYDGEWEIIKPPSSLVLPSDDIDSSSLEVLKECDVVLLETLTVGAVRETLYQAFNDRLPQEVTLLPSTSIAEAALDAAERVSQSKPVYFDFLPQISTIIHTSDGSASFDLIEEGETLPAGQLYRSRKPAEFGIPPREDSFTVYLKKENAVWPRKAVTELGTELHEAAPVDLWVEQSPAAGRAKIYMQSTQLARQFYIDWDTAEEIQMSWDELIEKQDNKPTIPHRMVLPCGTAAWNRQGRYPGLLQLLTQNIKQRLPGWRALADQLNQHPNGHFCISSDGDIPNEIHESTIDQLDQLTQQAVEEVQKRVSGTLETDNQSLRFLTWQFRRCPPEIAYLLLDAVKASSNGRSHVFVPHHMSLVLVYQGIGRVACSEDIEEETIRLILGKPVEQWKYRNETACLAFLLSRSDTAPLLLGRDDIELISKRVVYEFSDQLGSSYTKFNYAPFLLVGLLRWRLKEPRQLVSGQDPVATQMAECVQSVICDLENRRNESVKIARIAEKYLKILEEILSELEGAGTNPDILIDINLLSGAAVDQ